MVNHHSAVDQWGGSSVFELSDTRIKPKKKTREREEFVLSWRRKQNRVQRRIFSEEEERERDHRRLDQISGLNRWQLKVVITTAVRWNRMDLCHSWAGQVQQKREKKALAKLVRLWVQERQHKQAQKKKRKEKWSLRSTRQTESEITVSWKCARAISRSLDRGAVLWKSVVFVVVDIENFVG